jgi:AAA family ATP:ADP antiporter
MLQRAVRAAFFLWLSVSNLVCLSTLWARVADIFGSNAAARLFGFLGAGATCGERCMPPTQMSSGQTTIS